MLAKKTTCSHSHPLQIAEIAFQTGSFLVLLVEMRNLKENVFIKAKYSFFYWSALKNEQVSDYIIQFV